MHPHPPFAYRWVSGGSNGRNRTAGWLLGSSLCLFAGLALKTEVPFAVVVGFFLGLGCALTAAASYFTGLFRGEDA